MEVPTEIWERTRREQTLSSKTSHSVREFDNHPKESGDRAIIVSCDFSAATRRRRGGGGPLHHKNRFITTICPDGRRSFPGSATKVFPSVSGVLLDRRLR